VNERWLPVCTKGLGSEKAAVRTQKSMLIKPN